MRRTLFTVHCSLLTAFLLTTLLLSSCMPTPEPPLKTSLLIYRFKHPAFIEYSSEYKPVKEIPFSIPPNCGLNNTFPAPIGQFLLIELDCPNGQTVLFLDTETGSTTQPITAADAHFLAWTSNGTAAYLKVDSLGSPQIIRAHTDGTRSILHINEYTYDLSVNPINDDITFTFSSGLGFGSELHGTQYAARSTHQLYADPYHYISFARYAPDGKQIAFIKIPDIQTPYTVGELWSIDSTGANPRKLADADAGHGYAANWSPDGKRIAFVVRENLKDESADQNADALISNIYIVEAAGGELTQVTHYTDARAETPFWSPDGNTLAFNVVLNGRMAVSIVDVGGRVGSSASRDPYRDPGEIKPLETESTCCPAWMRK